MEHAEDTKMSVAAPLADASFHSLIRAWWLQMRQNMNLCARFQSFETNLLN